MPTEQAFPRGKSSSALLSQSLSSPSQRSAAAFPATALQRVPTPSQTMLPFRRHSPTPAEHACPTVGKPSSVSPSQSSSTALPQTSSTGTPACALHSVAVRSPEHTLFPFRTHAPPQTEQAAPTSKP